MHKGLIGVVAGLMACQVQTSGGTGTRSPASAAAPSGDFERASGDSAHDEITVIDVTGKSRAEAEAAMRSAGVTGEITARGDGRGARACGSVPGPGRKTLGHLSLEIVYCGGTPTRDVGPVAAGGGGGGSVGNGQIVMPDITGKTLEEAAAIIRAAGFSNGIEQSRPVDCDNPAPVDDRVKCQDPEPGKRVAKYTLVQVQIYHTW